MHNKLEILLREAGLKESEIIVYLNLLKDPCTTKWDLVKRTNLDKNKVYRACDKLVKLKMITNTEFGISADSLDYLILTLENSKSKLQNTINKIKKFLPFLKIPVESVSDFEILDSKDKILEKYMMMSQIKYNTCLDFGDLENFVPVINGLEPVFKFRTNRYIKNLKNKAICTTNGPYTSCMMRKQDLENFNSQIDHLNIKFKNSWIIFSDSNDYVMFNYFNDKKNPSSVLINSKIIADTQRLQFDQFYKNLEKF